MVPSVIESELKASKLDLIGTVEEYAELFNYLGSMSFDSLSPMLNKEEKAQTTIVKKNIKKVAIVEKGKKFTEREDEIILAGVARYGKRWDLIVKELHGREPGMVKNRYYYALKNSFVKQSGKVEIGSQKAFFEGSTVCAESESNLTLSIKNEGISLKEFSLESTE